jgi:hypothetical protein
VDAFLTGRPHQVTVHTGVVATGQKSLSIVFVCAQRILTSVLAVLGCGCSGLLFGDPE